MHIVHVALCTIVSPYIMYREHDVHYVAACVDEFAYIV